MGQSFEEDYAKKLSLKEEFLHKVREDEIKLRQRSRCKWLKEGDKNTKFFHGMASATPIVVNNEVRLEKNEDIIKHIQDYFLALYSKEWDRHSLNNLPFEVSGKKSQGSTIQMIVSPKQPRPSIQQKSSYTGRIVEILTIMVAILKIATLRFKI